MNFHYSKRKPQKTTNQKKQQRKKTKTVPLRREKDRISTCLPEPDSAHLHFQGHQMKTMESKTHPLVFTPFTYSGYIEHPTPHTLTE